MRGQSTLEYTMLVVAAVAALLGMGLYVRRGIQANVKTIETRINEETKREPTEPGVPPDGFPPVEPPGPPDGQNPS